MPSETPADATADAADVQTSAEGPVDATADQASAPVAAPARELTSTERALRNDFAGFALNGLLASRDLGLCVASDPQLVAQLVARSFELADAMLAASEA
jgi:hypothetical protein